MNSPILKKKLPFATIEFYENYVVCKIKQDLKINIDEIIELHKLYKCFFKNKKYGYIFDRTYDYVLDPIAYMKCQYYSDVKAFAVVAPNPTTKLTVQFEQKFSQRELKIFDTLEEAQKWIKDIDFY